MTPLPLSGAWLPAIDPVLSHGSAATLACVLLLGALDKLRDGARWQAALQAHQVLPAGAAAPVAAAWPWIEMLAAACLLPLAWRGLGAGLSLALLLAASAAVAVNLARGRTAIDCGCGGAPVPLSTGLLARNGVLGGLALLAGCPADGRVLGGLDMAAVAGAVVFGCGLYLLANGLLRQHAQLSALRRGHRS